MRNRHWKFMLSIALAVLWGVWGVDIAKTIHVNSQWDLDIQITVYIVPFLVFWWLGCQE